MRSPRKNRFINSTRSKTSFVGNVGLRHFMGLVVTAVIFGLFATPPAAAQGLPCTQCLAGAHWVDNCGPGVDQIANTGALVGIDTNLDCVVDVNLVLNPCSAPNNLLVVSKSVHRDDSQNFPGIRPIDGYLDVIDTEILSMCLTGGGFTLRAGLGQGQGPYGALLDTSLGAIAELPGDSTLAESFFDVFFEVYVPPPVGMYLYNQTPLRVAAIIKCAPPQARYIHPMGCLPLFTSPILGQGIQVANLVTAEHNVNPPPIPAFSSWGLIALILVLLAIATWVFFRRKRVVGVRT